jgi:PKHD-type hydroxylase
MTTSTTQGNFTDAATVAPSKVASLEIVSINKSELFTKEECETILGNCIEELWLPATVVGSTDGNFHRARRQKLRGDIAGFPFLNVRDVTKLANTEIYDFKLLGIIDQDFPQIFSYGENDFYKMHMELNSMSPSRKLSFVINLSDPESYEGGDIEFLNISADPALLKEQGACLIFPSYLAYSIAPVIKGTKKIIVGHVHGAVFK